MRTASAPRAAREVVALLLDAGAPIDAVDDRGRTALMMAAELGRGEVVDLLLARGADRTHHGQGRQARRSTSAADAKRARKDCRRE